MSKLWISFLLPLEGVLLEKKKSCDQILKPSCVSPDDDAIIAGMLWIILRCACREFVGSLLRSSAGGTHDTTRHADSPPPPCKEQKLLFCTRLFVSFAPVERCRPCLQLFEQGRCRVARALSRWYRTWQPCQAACSATWRCLAMCTPHNTPVIWVAKPFGTGLHLHKNAIRSDTARSNLSRMLRLFATGRPTGPISILPIPLSVN
jgi:hypothetical protein